MKDIKSIAKAIGHHCKIFAKGFIRTVYGTATAGLIVMAVYGFATVPSEGGYVAVLNFIASTATVAIALMCVYDQGAKKKKRGGYAK